jgi:ribonuclease I
MVKKSKAKPAKALPNGWMVLTKYRKKGASKGKLDRTYYSPEMETFRSLRAAKKFLIDKAYSTGEAFIAANAAEEEESEDNLIVEQKNEVINIAEITAASSAEALANDNSNVVIVIDSSSSDDDSMWM